MTVGAGKAFNAKTLNSEETERTVDQEYEDLFPQFANARKALTTQGATDQTTAYANAKDYYLYIEHLPSGLTWKFKAILTDYSDSFTSNWNSEPVYGRMDDIYTFQNTTRQITVALSIPAFDLDCARCNLTKINILARKLYPYYAGNESDNALTIARAPLLRIRFANLIRNGGPGGGGLLGKMNGFSFTPVLDDGFYDLPGTLYPKTININFTFDVLHEHTMGWTDVEDGDELQWSDGTGNAWPYATPKINDDQVPEPTTTVTDADDNADKFSTLGSV